LILTERIRTIGELASGAAHDFNNYLMTILGRTQLLQMNIKQKFLREDLDVIEKAAKDGAEMVRKLQELNHRQDTREAKPLYLKDLINDSLMFSQQKIKAKTQIKGQETIITTNMDPSLVVSGNPAEFREIFTNLIFNAFDAMPDGGELKIETWREPKTHEAIVIIQDTGCGMPPEVRKKIFDPFFTTKGRNGTGLGLSVVYRITTSLRGDIEVESEVGVGTKFILYLPISTEIPDQEHKPVIAISPKIKTSSSIKLLVVDDEIDLLKTIVEVLKLKFDRVDMATSGKEALDKIGECDYDVVLTDLGMPEMSGWEVAEKVKGLLPASKVILVTGWGMHAEDELINHEAYVDTILSKPYDLHQLLMIIEQVFSDDQGASVGD
ncbi:MAG: response regulator, partial [Calditrichaeota bacterium]|nr:response regulator [Calditrichota bacterium]